MLVCFCMCMWDMYVYAGMWHVYTYVIHTLIPVHTSQTMYRSKRNAEHGIVFDKTPSLVAK